MKYIPILIITIFLSFPSVVGAEGLVSCEGTDCNFCDVVRTADNVLSFVISFMVLASVMLMVYAGVRITTSVGDSGAVEEGKKLLSNVIIGFIIILASWTIVDTLLKATIGGKMDIGKIWAPIDCGKIMTPVNYSGTNPPPNYDYDRGGPQ